MSIVTQTHIESDVPSVLIYNNYVMYDRWMSYKRLNRTKDDFLTQKEYYDKNYAYFLVLKYYKKDSGEIYMILYDTECNRLYSNKSYIYTHNVKVEIEYNEFYKEYIPYITIINSNSEWNIGKNSLTHKYLIEEFKDINIDRLLSFHEFLNLPEFESNFYPDYKDYESDDDISDYDEYENYNSEYYDYDDEKYMGDYDDIMHGPEHTIEDDSELENE